MSASWIASVVVSGLLTAAFFLAGRAVSVVRSDRLSALIGTARTGTDLSTPGPSAIHSVRTVVSLRTRVGGRRLTWAVVGTGLAFVGFRLAGPGGLLAGVGVGAGVPLVRTARSRHQRKERAERQLAEVAESTAMAVRSGLSIRQAVEFAAEDVESPMRDSLEGLLRANELGAALETALHAWAASLGSDEAVLFVMVLSIHAKSGGDLAGALDEVSATIRHRMSVRRELRALSAQARLSGAILGSLPIAFFVVLSASSRSELAPVYRSPAGIAMVGGGLALQALAYFWIRHLLRVEA